MMKGRLSEGSGTGSLKTLSLKVVLAAVLLLATAAYCWFLENKFSDKPLAARIIVEGLVSLAALLLVRYVIFARRKNV